MHLMKRTIITITRQWKKNILLFFVITILGLLLSFSISLRHSFRQLDMSLMERTAPIVMLGPRMNVWNTMAMKDMILTMEHIESVADLPYIRSVHIRTQMEFDDFYNEQFIPRFLFEEKSADSMEMLDLLWNWQSDNTERVAYGVFDPLPAEFEIGILELSEGRFMTVEEIENKSSVALIPKLFAEHNQLSIGDKLTWEHNILPVGVMLIDERPSNEEMLFHEAVEFEIIGLFDIVYDDFLIEDVMIDNVIVDLFNRIFIPYSIIEDLMRATAPAHNEWLDWNREQLGEEAVSQERVALTEDNLLSLEAAFLLYSSRDRRNLEEAANEILPDWLTFLGSEGEGFSPVELAMDQLLFITDLVFWISAVAVVAILSLMIVSSIHERRHEIGIYLGLGEKRKKVLYQVLLELGIVAFLGMGVALLIGRGVSPNLSYTLLESELIHQMSQPMEHLYYHPRHRDLHFFRHNSLTVVDIMEMSQMVFSIESVGVILGAGLFVVLISASIPILYLYRLKPKEILLQARIQ